MSSSRFDTLTARAGVDTDPAHGAVMPPLYLTSNFSFAGFEQKRTFDYSRSGNPTRETLAEVIATLEGGQSGVVTSSGMAALDLVFGLARAGDLIIAPHDCYGGTHRLLSERAAKGSFRVDFVDQTDHEALATALKLNPRLLLIETPSNPLLRIVDVRSVATAAKAVGAEVVVDNTFLSPALQRPIALGADYVVHSTTKYLNGHSDVVGGAVVAADRRQGEALASWANTTGVTGAPFDAYQTLRGLRTLSLRVHRQTASAGRVALFLSQHKAVKRVLYPGLKDHPGHEIAQAQQSGFGAMLSFELKDGRAATRNLLGSLRLFTLAESLGGVESLIAHPATMTHASMDPHARHIAGIGDDLLRLSIGLEDADDLLEDLEQALAAR
ncbi:MAG: cystathionine gamma-synthase [Caulobacter sp.]